MHIEYFFLQIFKWRLMLKMFILVPHELELKIFIFAESVHTGNLGMRSILLRVDFL